MSSEYTKVSGNKAKFTFSVPHHEFDEALNTAYLRRRGRINVPGFRKGKAPRKLIETMFGEAFFYDDALELLFPDLYHQAVTESGVKPVDHPSVDVEQIGAGKELKFSAEVFVSPDVTLGAYKDLTIKHMDQVVSQAQVEEKIKEDQEKLARMIDVTDGVAAEGHIVNIDYSGLSDGHTFQGGTAEDRELTIGSGSFIPGFEEQLVGMSIGEEKDIELSFPDHYHASELAGKPVLFHVKLNSIRVKELPELDDEFAQDVSEFNTFEEYRKSVQDVLEEKMALNNKIEVEGALIELAVLNASVDIPAVMIDDQVEYIVRDIERNMALQGIKMEDFLKYTSRTLDSLKEQYRPEAEMRVRTDLVLDAIRVQDNIQPKQENIDDMIMQYAKESQKGVEEFKSSLTEQQLAYIEEKATHQALLDMMRAGCRIVSSDADADLPETKKQRSRAKTAVKSKKKKEDEQQ
jgi:trigger factor